MKGGLHFFLLLLCSCSFLRGQQYEGKSDHFDGDRFFNQHTTFDKSFWNYLDMRSKTTFKKWPERVPIKSTKVVPDRLFGESRVFFVNHSTVLIQSSGFNILTDPIWTGRASPLSWAGPGRAQAPGIAFEDLPEIDLILISHDHYDHLSIETLQMIQDRYDPVVLCGLGVKKVLEDHDIRKVVELDWWDEHKLNNSVTVTFTPAQHFSGRGLWDQMTTLWGSFVIRVNERQFYFAGDTGYSPHFKTISDKFGPMDLSLIPIGAYKPRWFMQKAHINPDEAVKAHLDLRSKLSLGIHWGTFQQTQEGWKEPLVDLEKALKKYKVPLGQFRTLNNGQTLNL